MGFCLYMAIYLISLLLTIFADRIVAWYAVYCRNSYPDKPSLEQADRLMMFNPLGKFLMGTMSDYATKGPEHPEAFPRMIWFFRLIGLIPTTGCTIIMIYMIFK